MDIGERIHLDESEQRALKTADAVVPEEWPLEHMLALEGLIRERILDKRSLMDEMRSNKEIAANTETVFRLRSDLAVLHNAHDQILEYAMSHLDGE